MATDIRYIDPKRVKAFLEENGFVQDSVQPSLTTGHSTQGNQRYTHADGRSVYLGLVDNNGTPQISGLHLEDGADRTIQAPRQRFNTVEELADFVNYGRISNPADRDQKMKVTTEMIEKAKREWISKPMGQYSSWSDCKGDGKSDAYCGYLYHHASPEGHKSVSKGGKVPDETAFINLKRMAAMRWGELRYDPTYDKYLVGQGAGGSASQSAAGTMSQSSDGGKVRSEQMEPTGSNPEIGTHSQSGGPGGAALMEHPTEQFKPGAQNPLTGGAVLSEAQKPRAPGEAPQGAPAVPDNSKHHANMAYSLGNKPIVAAQRHLESQGYQLTGTSAAIGADLTHTYAHPEGHTVELHSQDGKMVSGIDYAIPKPPKPQKPQANVFASQQQSAQQPQQPQAPQAPQGQPQVQPKQQSAYTGGAPAVTGQGRAEEAITRSFRKGIPLGSGETPGGAGIFCELCHTAMGVYANYKGLKICRRCVSMTPGVSKPMRK